MIGSMMKLNNRNIELVNLDYEKLVSDTGAFIEELEEVNIEILLFGMSLTRCNTDETRRFIKKTKLTSWLKYKNIRKSDLLVNYFYYKEYIQYAIIELVQIGEVEYLKGNLIYIGEKKRNISDRDIVSLMKNIKLDDVRKVLNEY